MSDSIRSLASLMVARKKAGAPPYILFLGAEASLCSDCSNMMRIVDDFLEQNAKSEFDEWVCQIQKINKMNKYCRKLLKKEIDKKKCALFFEKWGKFDNNTRFSILNRHILKNKIPSEGYNDLAQIMKKGFIQTVFSTNLNNLLEIALENAGLRRSQDFIVLTNGKDKPDEIANQCRYKYFPYQIIKLHGNFPESYAFSPKEIFDLESKIKYKISRFIEQSLIVVGYNLQDRDIHFLFQEEGDEIYFINPTISESKQEISLILEVRGRGSIIDGSDGNFNTFFRELREYIEDEDNSNGLAQFNQRRVNTSHNLINAGNATTNEVARKGEIPTTFIDSFTGMEFVLIPAGEFTMGSEVMSKKVTINNSYYMGIYPVTQKQWKEVMECNRSHFKDDDRPVENVSWHDAQDFIRKLNQKEGLDKYRLPSEAEWEYACKAKTTTEFYFGNEKSILDEYAWFSENSCLKTHPVGKKKPNPFGLYDMHGNVLEWCQDIWNDSYENAPSDENAWESGDSSFRVSRGGSWNHPVTGCQSSYRTGFISGHRSYNLSFRVVRTL